MTRAVIEVRMPRCATRSATSVSRWSSARDRTPSHAWWPRARSGRDGRGPAWWAGALPRQWDVPRGLLLRQAPAVEMIIDRCREYIARRPGRSTDPPRAGRRFLRGEPGSAYPARMPARWLRLLVAAPLLASGTVAGCSLVERDCVAPVSGTVSYDGKLGAAAVPRRVDRSPWTVTAVASRSPRVTDRRSGGARTSAPIRPWSPPPARRSSRPRRRRTRRRGRR